MSKNTLSIIGAIIGVVVASIIARYIFSGQQGNISFETQLMKAAEEVNKICPYMVDSETRLDNALGGPGKKFIYNYTLINYLSEELDLEQLKSSIYPSILNTVKTNPDMATFRDNDVVLVYRYKDKENMFLFDIEIGPEEYKP